MRKRRKAMKKLVSEITIKHVAVVAAVCVVLVSAVSAATGNLSTLAVLGKGQLAVAGEADMQCTPDKDFTCPFGTPKEKCSAKQKPGGQGAPCMDTTNGQQTPGKCTAEMKCKGEPQEGKPPEMPKMPEPPKKEEPKKEEPKEANPCDENATGSNGIGNYISGLFGGGSESSSRSSTDTGSSSTTEDGNCAKKAEACPADIYNFTGTSPKIDPTTGLPCATANSGDVWYAQSATTTSIVTPIIAPVTIPLQCSARGRRSSGPFPIACKPSGISSAEITLATIRMFPLL